MKRKPSFTFGMTKEEHDLLASELDRPLTQGPIQLRKVSQDQTVINRKSTIDQLIDLHVKRSDNDNS